MSAPFIPENYSQWQNCIVNECGIPLTEAFVDKRIATMEDLKNEHTRQFIRCFGEAHYESVLVWFKQAKDTFK